jgi:outer membrane protein TolC
VKDQNRRRLSGTTWAASIVAAFGLAGCVNYAGNKSDKQIAPPANYETKESLPAEGGQWPAMDWAGQFGDPQLSTLIDEALAGNPTINQSP